MQNVLYVLSVLFVFGGSVKADEIREEMAEAFLQPFKKELRKVDPATGAAVDAILTGPAFKAKRGSDFDYYRYVTYYNVLSHRERFSEWPIQRENCSGDDTALFASWSKSVTFTSTVNASISVEGLGLGVNFSKSKSVSAGRNLNGKGKFVIDHIPYIIKEDWEGTTYLQTSNLKTGQEIVIKKQQGKTPFWFTILFPMLAPREYPMPFSAKNAEWTLDIEHKKLAPCPE